MWREFISTIGGHYEFADPARPEEIDQAQEALGIVFPTELRDLLLETNGLHGTYGLGIIWPVDTIASENLEFRNNPDFPALYMPFDHLLFFGDAGNGDQYAFPILTGKVEGWRIFMWNHETDSRESVAYGLENYLKQALQ
jgi:hypothetical protein